MLMVDAAAAPCPLLLPHRYQAFEAKVIYALQRLQGCDLAVPAPRPAPDSTAASVAQQIAALGEGGVPLAGDDLAGLGGAFASSGFEAAGGSGDGGVVPVAAGPCWVQPRSSGLESNAGAAAAAALLAIAKQSDAHKRLVQAELQLQVRLVLSCSVTVLALLS